MGVQPGAVVGGATLKDPDHFTVGPHARNVEEVLGKIHVPAEVALAAVGVGEQGRAGRREDQYPGRVAPDAFEGNAETRGEAIIRGRPGRLVVGVERLVEVVEYPHRVALGPHAVGRAVAGVRHIEVPIAAAIAVGEEVGIHVGVITVGNPDPGAVTRDADRVAV